MMKKLNDLQKVLSQMKAHRTGRDKRESYHNEVLQKRLDKIEMALERMVEVISLQQVEIMKKLQSEGATNRSGLIWSGPKVNLIELAYGIYLTGQVNACSVGLHECFKLMGECFGVDLGVPKRGLVDLM